MAEMQNLQAECNNCHQTWLPYGTFQKIRLPHEGTVTCPKCNTLQKFTWLDSETQTKLVQKNLQLADDKEMSRKLSDLEYKVQLLEKEIELEKKKRELVEAQLEKITWWAEEREQDFQEIQSLAEEVHEDREFREDNK